MTKAQREKAERVMLKSVLDENPKIKEIVDNLIANEHPEVTDVVEPVIEEQLKKARMEGVEIGWLGFALRAPENIKNMKTIDEAIKYFQDEADKIKDRFKI